ncbi:MAG: type II toxin-antitoxin system Phd/YefM family antitoxin [Proteobacteria bacterium]|nr:type II toxin-antitoxin system Phd/YefM family antitoxin [Pseudomonadota bacterium]
MRYSERVKPISWLKANAAEVLADLNDTGEPLLITQNGEARAVLQDVASYERTQQTLALLKLLALGQQDIDAGRLTSAEVAFDRVLAGARTSTED